MKVKVCANCGETVIGVTEPDKQETCIICLGHTFKEVELPDSLRCIYCHKSSKTQDILKIWKQPPFFNANNGTYYCGCRGWD